ncbi:MAG: NUDIX hydrolase [Pseudomonadota bacterium]
MTAGKAPPDVPTRDDVPVRDAASLIVWNAERTRVLVGKRQATAVFVPGKYVFPGGRLEEADTVLARRGWPHWAPDPHDLHNGCDHVALALAALRETCEETGLAITDPGPGPFAADTPDDLPAVWRPIMRAVGPGVLHARRLVYIGRAVTPPGNVRRYDTRFYECVLTDTDQPDALSPDGEFTDWRFIDAADMAAIPLHIVTRTLLADRFAAQGAQTAQPLYYMHDGAGFSRVPLTPWRGPNAAPGA